MRFMITQRRGPMAVKGMELRLDHLAAPAPVLNSAGAEAACRSARRLWLRWAQPTQRKARRCQGAAVLIVDGLCDLPRA